MQHPTGQTGAMPCDNLQRFHGLEGPDHAGKSAQYARFFSGRNRAGWWGFRKKATVAGGGETWIEDAELSLKLMDRASHKWLAEEPGGVRYQKAGWEIVGAVNHDIVAADQIHCVASVKSLLVCLNGNIGIQARETSLRTFGLGRAHPAFVVEDLPLQIGEIDCIAVHDADASCPRCSEIKGCR